MSVRGGRPLRRQIEAALSDAADPLGEEGLGPPDGPVLADEDGGLPAAVVEANQPMRVGRRGRERHVDEEIKAAYRAAQASGTSRAAAASAAAASSGGAGLFARRLPDLAALPPLLHAAGAFASLRARLGAEGAPLPVAGHHASLASVPHGAKTFLAAALATVDSQASPQTRAAAPSGAPAAPLGAAGDAGPLGAVAGERLCWVARDSEVGDRVAEELQAWLGDPDAVAVLEPRTALAYERSELVRDETAARVAALAAWRSGRARVLVASVQALLQHTLDPAEVPVEPRRLRVGDRVGQDGLLRDLLALGYDPVLEVAGRGEFARRGGLVDVFPSAAPLPIRIEFFGDEIDSMRAFDPADQRSLHVVDEVVLLPASEFLVPSGGVAEIGARIARLPGRRSKLPDRLAADLARFEEGAQGGTGAIRARPGGVHDGPAAARALATGDAAEVWAAVLCPATGLDHVPPSTLLVLDEPGEVADAADFLWRQAAERRSELVTAGDLPGEWPEAYLGPRSWKSRLLRGRTLELTWESDADPPTGGGTSMGDPFGWREPALPPARTARLAGTVASWAAQGYRIVLASDQALRLADLLAEGGLPTAVVDRLSAAPAPGTRSLVGRSLNGGFGGGPDGLMFVTDREIFGSVRVRRPKALRRVVPRDVLERLTTGDLVVHVDHGIARYERMLRRGLPGEERDYLELSFAGTDKIFLPVEQINRISRYSGGENPALSKLGGAEWLRTKQRVKRAVTDLARELLEIYAARASAQGFAYSPDTPWQAELEASFPYEETLDQLRATAEVKLDMEAGRPMDRLVVGDVGYGKTEVALRSVFKAIQDGKQVAVLVPTTVLAAQHYATFAQRFAAFPITVRLLSRYVPAAEQGATIEGLAAGSVDLVIGTHRLLSKDVRFRDLGMVIVDEEQHFGVAAKERLKKLRREVDVLTLSATPIPRTLNLALAGVRDLSLMETPPEDRLPIQTRVAEASAGLVRDAILRELDRGGQVFFVHNRVETIEAQAEQLRALLPGVRIAVGHGQMPEGRLERVMLGFAGGATEVLVCTTIIESGLDIPNANTIIIDRADALGLAQLYQLRGRVGRSSRRAYAYLLYRRRERLSDVARKRLQAIFNASELGAGFQIALSDLEIRGAGNILGAEQHGHVAAVGFDLYTRLLAEAVEEQKAEFEGRPAEIERPGAVVDLPVDAHLPDAYVPETSQKLDLYRRLGRVRTAGELSSFRQELQDRFGPLPQPVLKLMEVVELRLAAETAGIASISREEGELVVRFGTLSRAAAMRALAPMDRDVVRFGTNQARIRLPRDAARAWSVAQAVVSRLLPADEQGSPARARIPAARGGPD
ncbi:MAG: transcription-repair coupling factor [Candidatus Limnocylindrales bacterium]